MTEIELLAFARGPGLQWSVAIFVFGVVFRFLAMWLLGGRRDLAEARSGAFLAGLRTVATRSMPSSEERKDGGFVIIGSWIFHLGFVITLFFLVPHIYLFRAVLGFGWPGPPRAVIAFSAVLAIVSMVALLAHRCFHPVRRFLATAADYVAWTVTFLPLLTG